jgi:hypothetical protein
VAESTVTPGIGRYRCPLLGTTWLRFSAEGRIPGCPDPVILRLRPGFELSKSGHQQEEGTGFYL